MYIFVSAFCPSVLLLYLAVFFKVLWRTKTTACSPNRPLYPPCKALGAQTSSELPITCCCFWDPGGGGGRGWGVIKQIGGRSKSILSSLGLSLRALICCCQCPLTDVCAQRSGPSSHAATMPPDTQPTQQQPNKQGTPWFPNQSPLYHPSIPPSIYPSFRTSHSLLIDFALVTLYHQPNWQLPLFERRGLKSG